jgi:hypothetical protein
MTFLLLKHRQMQSASDSGAIAAAAALASGGNITVMATEADAIASKLGFTPGVNSTTVTVNNPPSKGPNAGNTSAVEVIIAQPQTLGLAKVFHAGIFTVSTRSVALTTGNNKFCFLGLDSSASPTVDLKNNAAITNPDCGMVSNSSSSTGIQLSNNVSVAGEVYSHGGVSMGNNATVGSKKTNQPVVADPYASVTPGTPPACTAQSGTVNNNKSASLTAGHFCSGWNFNNNATVTLGPGTYYVDSQLNISNNVSVTGTGGLTIIINGSYAMSAGNNVILNLTAPTTGTFAGLVFYSPSTNSSSITQGAWNNLSATITGAFYFPSQTFQLQNNAVLNQTTCTQIIARIVDLQNNVASDSQCVKKITVGGAAQLVE